MSKSPYIPLSTYRLQLNHQFPFAKATEVIPYLDDLGIDAVYCSPYFAAVPGSLHGYDVVSFRTINPEIGTEEEFKDFCAALKKRKMGHIFDLVANHMAASPYNRWWTDVLEHGPGSMYCDFFDINWTPIQKHLTHKILLAMLGEDYGVCLNKGIIKLKYEKGHFFLEIYEQIIPLSPNTYPYLLTLQIVNLKKQLEEKDYTIFKGLIEEFRALEEPSQVKQKHNRHIRVRKLKQRLGRLSARSPEILEYILRNVEQFSELRLLDELLGKQNFRLAFWQEAAHDVNYRRFFEIKDLIALKVDEPHTFKHVHRTLIAWVKKGWIQGIRIDHPDGFYEPDIFYERLHESVDPCYIIVEKILQSFEKLPDQWKVHGTVGYEYLNCLNGVFVDKQGEKEFDEIYKSFAKFKKDPEELLYDKKKQFLLLYMLSEINNLSEIFYQKILKVEKSLTMTSDELKVALVELISCFPVYRTYITTKAKQMRKDDDIYMKKAFMQAEKKKPESKEVFLFLKKSLLRKEYRDILLRLQQLTPPIFAKGFEDTFLYVYNRLISLNEVGGEPLDFGISADQFHEQNVYRAKHWPMGMITTSTHDTKRSEDLRMRINVLSEMPTTWKDKLQIWSKQNASLKKKVKTLLVPDPNAEYFIYQTLLGVWPHKLHSPKELLGRVSEYLIKASREAKVYTNWYSVEEDYEKGIKEFLSDLFSTYPSSPFWQDFLPFQKEVSFFGMLGSLSSISLKMASPGVIDIYQGIEKWDYSLVDPDNRRKVDYIHLKKMLDEIKTMKPSLENIESGKLKMYLHWKGLNLRKEHPDLFIKGSYQPLKFSGKKKNHVIGCVRRYKNECLVAISGRFFSQNQAFDEITAIFPEKFQGKNIYTGDSVHFDKEVEVSSLLNEIPTGMFYGRST